VKPTIELHGRTLSNQIGAFGNLPVYVGIGNHEVIQPRMRALLDASLPTGSINLRFGVSEKPIKNQSSLNRTITGFKVEWTSSISITPPTVFPNSR